ncbi:MAG: bifunctional 2-C-methyl-D-erythritol 4-phosphate cytidylyltransferase/2-C-methyl-D-erythritol 2,4-cyclodiphosphate synthase [Rhizobiaceae bacterium]
MAQGRPEPTARKGLVGAVIVAAGRGERAGQSAEGPKQYRRIGGVPVIRRTLETFAAHPSVGPIVVVVHPDDHDLLAVAAGELLTRVQVTDGGATRQDSVRLGLQSLRADAPERVLIHDAARPFVDAALIDRTVAAIGPREAALPALAVSDTLKRGGANGIVTATMDRADLHAAQTPQGFPFWPILAAHMKAATLGKTAFTDDAAVAEWANMPVRLVEGSPDNVKLTWAREIEAADRRLSGSMAFPDVRTGNGYDVHAFETGDAVILCGVAIPHTKRLSGHSDADVGLHALTDALLATLSEGDIGTHFPPSDPQWKGAPSRIFVEHAANLVRASGGRIAHCDVTLIAEAPKVGPHRAAMQSAMASMLRISPGRVSIKATTNERLGFVGREEGIAAIATATVVFPGNLPE